MYDKETMYFLRKFWDESILHTGAVPPPIMPLRKNMSLNHMKFLLITDMLLDGVKTDIVLTGSSNL